MKNTSGEVVAKFDLTHPSPPQPQNWTAEELPATKSSGDIAMTLERLQPHASEHMTNGVRQEWWYFHPIAKVAEQRMEAKDWTTSLLRMTDPLGNECSGTEVAASIHEPAWKVQLVAHRTERATFTEAETWKIADIELPAKNVAKPLTDAKTIDGVSVKLVAVAGAG